MKKVIILLISLFTLFWLLTFLYNPIKTQKVINNILDLWLRYVVVSMIPTYIISNMLMEYPFISYLIYPILKRIMHFENQKACSFFLLSIITSNPTMVILIDKSIKNNQLTITEGNRLLRVTSHLSILFIINILPYPYNILILLSQLLSSFLIIILSKNIVNNKTISTNPSFTKIYNQIIDELPSLLLTVLMTMMFVALIKIPIFTLLERLQLINIFRIPLAFLEITTGTTYLLNISLSFIIKGILINSLFSLNGLTILLQTIKIIKRTDLSINQFIKYRFIHLLLSNLCLIILFKFFF